jgi:CheY-like chemotaxis protein
MISKPNILYIDDEDINFILFEANFESTFNIHTATSGEKGLEILRASKDIKLVICDLKMPNMNGLEFISLAKSEFPDTLYILLTGFNLVEEISNAIKPGLIDKSLTKPFDMADLENAIFELLKLN